MTRSFDVFFDLRLNKLLSKQSKRQWFETSSRSLWRHYNVMVIRPWSDVERKVKIAPLPVLSIENNWDPARVSDCSLNFLRDIATHACPKFKTLANVHCHLVYGWVIPRSRLCECNYLSILKIQRWWEKCYLEACLSRKEKLIIIFRTSDISDVKVMHLNVQ